MKFSSPQRTWLPSALAGLLLLLTPFVVFLRFQGYPFLRSETLLCLAVVVGLGVLVGLLMEVVGRYSRTLIFSCLVVLLVDIQSQQPRVMMLVAVLAVSLVATWFLQKHLARYGNWLLLVLFVTSFVSPTRRPESNEPIAAVKAAGNPTLPVFLHLILDEQVGVEGIPEEFDPDGRHAEALRDFYLDRGFQVFGRAYTRFYNTHVSLPNLFNMDSTGYRFRHVRGKNGEYYLMRNRYFELMRQRGYQIHVYQSNVLDYCHDGTGVDVASCFTYQLEELKSIEGTAMSVSGKARIILGMYSRLSKILSHLHVPLSRVSSVSAMAVMERLHADLVHARPGAMYFVHLMLPHYPYVYDSACAMRKDPGSWLNGDVIGLKPRRNTAETRAQRYPLYLEQIACTNLKLDAMFNDLKEAGIFQNMVILVHGDHGSRLNKNMPRISQAPLSDSDMVDCFSTLFAIRFPAVPATYDRRELPLGPLLRGLMGDGRLPEGEAWAGDRQVFFSQGQPQMAPRTMPEFGRKLKPYQPRLR